MFLSNSLAIQTNWSMCDNICRLYNYLLLWSCLWLFHLIDKMCTDLAYTWTHHQNWEIERALVALSQSLCLLCLYFSFVYYILSLINSINSKRKRETERERERTSKRTSKSSVLCSYVFHLIPRSWFGFSLYFLVFRSFSLFFLSLGWLCASMNVWDESIGSAFYSTWVRTFGWRCAERERKTNQSVYVHERVYLLKCLHQHNSVCASRMCWCNGRVCVCMHLLRSHKCQKVFLVPRRI